jgi:hypothetical protein
VHSVFKLEMRLDTELPHTSLQMSMDLCLHPITMTAAEETAHHYTVFLF